MSTRKVRFCCKLIFFSRMTIYDALVMMICLLICKQLEEHRPHARHTSQ
ncbi:unnamed protein product [Amoebophrya sp. A25]|nr:unnamed protein product [Amoebophrya sp. A25]|eukprot:GSA25T00027209001.1